MRRTTPMDRKHLYFDSKKCVGCRLCEQWCVASHFPHINPKLARIQITRNHHTQQDQATYCHLCPKTPCISACQYNALKLNETVPRIETLPENCIACGACITACPFDHPHYHPQEKYVLICDLCGGSPACVEHCPEQAITYK